MVTVARRWSQTAARFTALEMGRLVSQHAGSVAAGIKRSMYFKLCFVCKISII